MHALVWILVGVAAVLSVFAIASVASQLGGLVALLVLAGVVIRALAP